VKKILCTGESVFQKVIQWLVNFLYIGNFRKVYLKQNVTPYMHCLAYHIPFFISSFGCISGQGVEKNNDIIKMIHQRKSSKWDGPSEALQVRKRLEYAHQENIGRSKRQYVYKSDYWGKDIFSIRSAKRQDILAEIKEADNTPNQINLENLRDKELQDMLTNIPGGKTRLHNRQKIISAIKDLK
jgi:hypothetical protein